MATKNPTDVTSRGEMKARTLPDRGWMNLGCGDARKCAAELLTGLPVQIFLFGG